jgi:hypothetical protein
MTTITIAITIGTKIETTGAAIATTTTKVAATAMAATTRAGAIRVTRDTGAEAGGESRLSQADQSDATPQVPR